MSDLAAELKARLSKEDPTASGSLSVLTDRGRAWVTCRLTTQVEEVETWLTEQLKALAPELAVAPFQNEREGLLVATAEWQGKKPFKPRTVADKSPDALRILYSGRLDPRMLKQSPDYKRMNWKTVDKVANCMEVLEFSSPVVVNQAMEVLDGNMRVELSLKHELPLIPAVVVEADEVKSAFLRIVLNRSSEFQRWYYSDEEDKEGVRHEGIDTFVDAYPQLQPLLEPLGVFGERILPQSFFGNTVIQYRIDEYNEQQMKYKQEIGLAAWAEEQRRLLLEKEARKKELADQKIKGKAKLQSLFDLVPQEEDFQPTYDVQAALEEIRVETKKTAATVTKAYDAKRKAEKEAKGQEWQTSRQSTKSKAAKARAAAAAKATGASGLEAEALVEGEE